jgi:spore maturation protein CgeB
MRIAFFGSSLVSSYWNGAATYYRGLLKQLALLGHDITFYEPDAFSRQQNRDIADPSWAKVTVYPATADGWQQAVSKALRATDVLVKASGVGVFDIELEQAVAAASPPILRIYWDVDAPATLEAISNDPGHHLRQAIPRYDMVFTYGGGEPVVAGYLSLGAHQCVPIYNALDPETHFRVAGDPKFSCDLGFLGNRLPDREARVDAFLLHAARLLPDRLFVLGGAGWDDKVVPANVRCVGHVGTADHNAFFASGLMTLNINRDSMARNGFSPPTRVFEALGAAACLITDQWDGIGRFLEPDREVLVASGGDEVAHIVQALTPARARKIAEAGRRRILAHHTYAKRALQVDRILKGLSARSEAAE